MTETPEQTVRRAADKVRTGWLYDEDRGLADTLAKWLDICANYMSKWPGDSQLSSPFKIGGYETALAVLGEEAQWPINSR